MTRSPSPPDDAKLKELILYIAAASEADPAFGGTKLNKILFFADFLSYRNLGRSITGHSYQKLEFGPAPRAILPVLRQMIEAGDCAEARRTHFGLEQKRIVPLRDPDLSLFTSAEIELVREVIAALWGRSATQVSDLSHDFIGWQAADIHEEIPYETVFVGRPRPLHPDEVEFARQLARELQA